jgi:hypothetical protein
MRFNGLEVSTLIDLPQRWIRIPIDCLWLSKFENGSPADDKSGIEITL